MGKETWYCWLDTVHEPWFNMAADELLLARAPETARVLVRIYRWDRPSVSFGSAQLCPVELSRDYTLVRRPTGGGVVYHDEDLTYTVIVPPAHPIMRLDRMESYRIFHEALLKELLETGVAAELKAEGSEHVDRSTMRCFVSPSRFDLVAPDGDKYAGAAQRRTRCGILHQGSIRLDAAGGSWGKLCDELLSSLRRQFNIEWQAWAPDEAWLAKVAALGNAKYAGDAWNLHHEYQEPEGV